MKPRVFVTRRIAPEALRMISEAAQMELWDSDLPPPREALKQGVAQAEGLLCLLTERIDADLLDGASRLRVVSNMAVGYDNIDVPALTSRHIPLGNTPGVLTETTADFAFALLLSAARRVVEADGYTRAGRWQTWGPMVLLGYDVHHATLGIVGLGRIGLALAKRALGFEMKVLYYSRSPKPEAEPLGLEYAPDLMTLLSRSDFVSIHVPLSAQTRHLIGPTQLAAMKPTAVLVNTSRGPVVDQAALYQALKSGRLFAAAIDVTEVEPIPRDDPLLTLSNVIIAPHIASGSVATRTRMAMMAAANLLAGLKGEPLPYCVNPEAMKPGKPA